VHCWMKAYFGSGVRLAEIVSGLEVERAVESHFKITKISGNIIIQRKKKLKNALDNMVQRCPN